MYASALNTGLLEQNAEYDAEKISVLVDKRFVVGIEVCRRNPILVRPPDLGRQHVGEVFVRAYHGDAS